MRLRWLDLLRTAAILGMIVFHAAYSGQAFYGWPISVFEGWWGVFGRSVAVLFLLVSGVSAGLWNRGPYALRKGWRRGWTILSAAMLVSLVTAVTHGDLWIRFGILHLVGVSAFLLLPLRKAHPAALAVLGAACLAAGPFVADLRVETWLLLPFGAKPIGFYTLDYFPIVPNLGWILLGFCAGKFVAARAWNPPRPSRALDLLAVPGRYSLWIYLLHQPVILAVLWLALGTR